MTVMVVLGEQLTWTGADAACVMVTDVDTRRRGPAAHEVLRDVLASGDLAGDGDTAFLLGDTLVVLLAEPKIDPAFDRVGALEARLPRGATARTAIARRRGVETVREAAARAVAAMPERRGAVLAL